ncbi:hypothetical protein HGQ17_08270 [Nesterenkonia sp. MY13]|uniref:DUF4143 domain-containing protein n=1 Tax=Nesterenkonia sedimenti TaxID=1463632 RepID=A0A7X8TKG1_9MICC|nr:hypothetical protein [Nesterenkonia sedimenti]NLS09992.1 hypothetical protein [Nesterenkonia sedimenti]
MEVDLVLEDDAGHLIGIEVNSGSSVRKDTLKGLSAFKEVYGNRMVGGYVVTGNAPVTPLGEGWWAIPADALRNRLAWSS